MELVADITLMVCGAKQTILSNEQEEQAQNSLEERFDYMQTPAKVELRSQNLRAQIYGQSRAQQHGKAKDHDPKGRYKRCQLNLRKDGTWTQSIAKVSVVKDVHEHIVKLGSYCDYTDQNLSQIPSHKGRTRSSLERLQDDKRLFDRVHLDSKISTQKMLTPKTNSQTG